MPGGVGSLDVLEHYLSLALVCAVQAVELRAKLAADTFDARAVLSPATALLYGNARTAALGAPDASRPLHWEDLEAFIQPKIELNVLDRRKCARRQKSLKRVDIVKDGRAAPLRTLRSTRGEGQSESKGSGSTTRMFLRRRIMYGQVIDPSLKAAEVSLRLASGTKLRLAERRVAMVRLLVQVRHQQWVRAESAKAYRPPTLLEDNPTSG